MLFRSVPSGRVGRGEAGVGVTLHWRPDPAREPELRARADAVAARLGLVVLEARRAVELRPPVALDKGVVVRELTAGVRAAVFAGDDAADLAAFAALRAAVAAGEVGQAVCVGVASDESPPDLVARSDLMVDGPSGLLSVLTRMADEVA